MFTPILRSLGVTAAFLLWSLIEGVFLFYLPKFYLARVLLGNFVAVVVLCVTWAGFGMRCLGQIAFLTTVGVTFRLVTEQVNEMLEGKTGLMLAVLAGHLAALGVALVWYSFLVLYSSVFS